MGHLFDSPVQVPCLPIALQQLSVATCTNWQPPGANSGDFCLNHIDSLETDDVYPQNPIKIWSMPKKCGIVLGARNWKWSWYVLAYCVLWCIMLLMDAYGGIWFGPPNLSWLTLQWLRYPRQSAPPPPRGRLWYAPVCDLQGSEGHATPKQITKPVELLRHDSTGWNMPRTHAHTLPSPLSLSISFQHHQVCHLTEVRHCPLATGLFTQSGMPTPMTPKHETVFWKVTRTVDLHFNTLQYFNLTKLSDSRKQLQLAKQKNG